MGTYPKIEKKTGVHFEYTDYVIERIMTFIVDMTDEYKRVYEIGSRYPDVSLTIVQQAFSNALFDNRSEVNINDFKKAIMTSKNIYPDVVKKSMPEFEAIFKDEISRENESHPVYESLDTTPE